MVCLEAGRLILYSLQVNFLFSSLWGVLSPACCREPSEGTWVQIRGSRVCAGGRAEEHQLPIPKCCPVAGQGGSGFALLSVLEPCFISRAYAQFWLYFILLCMLAYHFPFNLPLSLGRAAH